MIRSGFLNSLGTALLAATLAAPARARQAAETISYTPDYGCDYILAILDDAALRLLNRPEATAYVVAYPAPDSLPGEVIQHLNLADANLRERFRDGKGRIVSGVGPTREFLSFEITIVPPGGPRPILTPIASRYGLVAGRYEAVSARDRRENRPRAATTETRSGSSAATKAGSSGPRSASSIM